MQYKWYPARDSNPQNADFKSAAYAIPPAGQMIRIDWVSGYSLK